MGIVANRPIETFVFRNLETGSFGFKVRFIGREGFHHTSCDYRTLEAALHACDPRDEHVWEAPPNPDGGVVLVSRAFKEGTRPWRMQQARPGMRVKRYW